jgi:hypothetical protein
MDSSAQELPLAPAAIRGSAMTPDQERRSRVSFQPSLATPAEGAAEPPAFPVRAEGHTEEIFYSDWQQRLNRNLFRRSDGHWEPLSYWR